MKRSASTPAIAELQRADVSFTVSEYDVERTESDWGAQAARTLNIDPARVFKTLVVELDGRRLAVVVVPADARFRARSVAAVFGAREAQLANQKDAERATGYVIGGISPLGQRRKLQIAIDESALEFTTICISAGRRGLEIELAPNDLVTLTGAQVGPLT
ncbi:MAG: Cys-tRNA(Pro) deacylase [Thermomicrobiales bacterium]|nr:Cys-tRNA(Pro) deacylase [Thermomicrobiales bacterium]